MDTNEIHLKSVWSSCFCCCFFSVVERLFLFGRRQGRFPLYQRSFPWINDGENAFFPPIFPYFVLIHTNPWIPFENKWWSISSYSPPDALANKQNSCFKRHIGNSRLRLAYFFKRPLYLRTRIQLILDRFVRLVIHQRRLPIFQTLWWLFLECQQSTNLPQGSPRRPNNRFRCLSPYPRAKGKSSTVFNNNPPIKMPGESTDKMIKNLPRLRSFTPFPNPFTTIALLPFSIHNWL